MVQSVLSTGFRGLSVEWGREKDSGQLAEWGTRTPEMDVMGA